MFPAPGRRLLEFEDEGVVIDRVETVGALHHGFARDGAHRPTPDRGDAVTRRYRGSIMKAETVAQFETPAKPVFVALVFVDHLRVSPPVAISREQRVVDKERVGGGDQSRGPNRVEDL